MRGAPRSLEIVLGRADEAEQDQRQRKTSQVLGIDRERNERQKQRVSPHREEKVRGSGARHYTLAVCAAPIQFFLVTILPVSTRCRSGESHGDGTQPSHRESSSRVSSVTLICRTR
jgi:hypothetical protein